MKNLNDMLTLLNTKLSPDNMKYFTPNELAIFLVENDFVKSVTDVNTIVIEAIQKAIREDDELPIHYYTKDEPMPEESKIVDNVECLTDDYIANNLNG